MRIRFTFLLTAALLLLMPLAGRTLAAGVVGDGTPESCTSAALQTALGGGGAVSFNCGGAPVTITLTATLNVTATTTIDGANLVTLDGNNLFIILKIATDVPLLTVQNLNFINAKNTSTDQKIQGGAISAFYRSNITVINCQFSNNQVTKTYVNQDKNLDFGGGAIYIHTGTLTVSGSQFTGNKANNGTGGALHLLHSNAIVTDSTFDGNQATSYGGAVYSDGTLPDGNDGQAAGIMKFERNSFINSTGKGQGGAIFTYMYDEKPNLGLMATYTGNRFNNNTLALDELHDSLGGALRIGNGPAQIINTSFANNTAVEQGGAVWTGETTTISIDNSTFVSNQATDANQGYGGAIKNSSSGLFTLSNSTLAYNHAGQLGGGLYGDRATIRNTLFAFNTADTNSQDTQNCQRTYTNGGGNMQTNKVTARDQACTLGITFVADPLLGTLQNDGGVVEFLPLAQNSPAVDRGQNTGCTEKDVRGLFRPFDGNWDGSGLCDVGAYEFISFDIPNAANAPPYRNVFYTGNPTFTWGRLEWAVGYTIQIDNNSDFSSVNWAYQLGAVNTFTMPDTMPNGVFYWRIRGKRANNTFGTYSTGDNFIILPP